HQGIAKDLVEALPSFACLAPERLVHVRGDVSDGVLDRRGGGGDSLTSPPGTLERTRSFCMLVHAGTVATDCLHCKLSAPRGGGERMLCGGDPRARRRHRRERVDRRLR